MTGAQNGRVAPGPPPTPVEQFGRSGWALECKAAFDEAFAATDAIAEKVGIGVSQQERDALWAGYRRGWADATIRQIEALRAAREGEPQRLRTALSDLAEDR